MTAPTKAEALAALDSLDDYARMSVGVDAYGSRRILRSFIEGAAEQTPVAKFRCWTEPSSVKPEGRQFYDLTLLPAGNALPDGEYALCAAPQDTNGGER
jgi:hypothetical protein